MQSNGQLLLGNRDGASTGVRVLGSSTSVRPVGILEGDLALPRVEVYEAAGFTVSSEPCTWRSKASSGLRGLMTRR